MRISDSQESILDGFRCKRVRECERSHLDSIKGPLVQGDTPSIIPDLFRNDAHIEDDRSGALASYVVTNSDNDILMFFSIRCGELFEKVDHEKMILSHNALVALKILADPDGSLSIEEKEKAEYAIKTIP